MTHSSAKPPALSRVAYVERRSYSLKYGIPALPTQGSAPDLVETPLVAPLDDISTPLYAFPEGGSAKLEYRGLPLDEIEDLLPRSSAYRQAARILFPEPAAFRACSALAGQNGERSAVLTIGNIMRSALGPLSFRPSGSRCSSNRLAARLCLQTAIL